MICLVDGNSFYASCHEIFRPDLRGQCTLVLSNGDGAVVAMSKAAKAMGIPAFSPYFKVEPLLKQSGVNVNVFSSNYPLYGDISARMMFELREMAEEVYVYSVDEAFLIPPDNVSDLKVYGHELRRTVWKNVRIRVGVGMGLTKTLSKAANRMAKKVSRLEHVCVIENEAQREWVLKKMQVGDVWGIGGRLSEKIKRLGISTAWDLALADAKRIRKHFGVCVERTVAELNGIQCLELDDVPNKKQQIFCTRSFGNKETQIEPILESTAGYAALAAGKLRSQQSVVKTIHVFLQTSRFDDYPFSESINIQLPYATDDSRVIISAARKGIEELFVQGYRFAKSGVGLIEIEDKRVVQGDLFAVRERDKSNELMGALDSINSKFGRGTLFFAAQGANKVWQVRQEHRSPHYTTRWSDIPLVKCV